MSKFMSFMGWTYDIHQFKFYVSSNVIDWWNDAFRTSCKNREETEAIVTQIELKHLKFSTKTIFPKDWKKNLHPDTLSHI